jgi:hypothetical protein
MVRFQIIFEHKLYTDFLSLVTFPTTLKTEVTAKGDVVYSEVVREKVRKRGGNGWRRHNLWIGQHPEDPRRRAQALVSGQIPAGN